MNNLVPTIPDSDLLASGFSKKIVWNISKHPHAVIFGATGSGKTYLLKLLLGRICLHVKNARFIICDFKGDTDFSFLEGCQNFYRFADCTRGLECAVQELQHRQADSSTSRYPLFLVFDEWASYVSFLEKKEADSAKKNLSLLLMLARSFDIHVILSQQRLDASYFSGSRDNFSFICGMGKLSKESADMMFSEYKDIIDRNKSQGYGSLVLGSDFYNIRVPFIRNMDKLDNTILNASLQAREILGGAP